MSGTRALWRTHRIDRSAADGTTEGTGCPMASLGAPAVARPPRSVGSFGLRRLRGWCRPCTLYFDVMLQGEAFE
eukprot:14320994-Alexandrium_andersonii.AAC.1